jgi:glycine betaine/proline transport system ATP-binding protein
MKKIRVENLSKIFGHHPERGLELLEQGKSKDEIMQETKLGVGVDRATFDVDEGEIVVVMGLSGSGKSTLVRCINRLIDPTAGTVFIDDQEVTALDAKELRELRLKKLGMVFQNFALFPHRTVCQNAEYGLEIQGVDQAERRDKAMKALDQVGLKGWEDSYPTQLSGGMQQRVGLARALALDPDILLMDEAFSALDPLIRRDMQEELLELQEKVHKTILFISHDLDEALKLGDRIVLMKDGAIVQVGTAEEILTSPANDYVARFVEEVDISKVLTAESVMKKVRAVAYRGTDGPRASLKKMKREGISSLFVVNKEHKLVGVVTAEDCAKAAERGERDLESIMFAEPTTVIPDTPATDLIQILHDLPYPLAVVNENNKIKGVIVRGTLLAAIAERGSSEQ